MKGREDRGKGRVDEFRYAGYGEVFSPSNRKNEMVVTKVESINGEVNIS